VAPDTTTEAEDRSAGRVGPGARQPWQVSLACKLGSAARWANHQVDSFTAWASQAVLGPSWRSGRRRTAAAPLSALLGQLAQLLAEHASADYKPLERDARFWRLVQRIHARRPRLPATRRRQRRVPRADARAAAAAEQAPAASVDPETGVVDMPAAAAEPVGRPPPAPRQDGSEQTETAAADSRPVGPATKQAAAAQEKMAGERAKPGDERAESVTGSKGGDD
jgi:hypothetical protein